MHAAEYARAVVLERENQSLRENIHNLQHLLQALSVLETQLFRVGSNPFESIG